MRRAVLGLVLAAACAPAGAQAAQRVVGGQPVAIAAHPYQVALLIGGRNVCGGSIRDAQHVVTAAHCLDRDGQLVEVAALEVVAGTADLTAGGERTGVLGLQVHPGYDPATERRDVAVLRLRTPLRTGAPLPVVRPEEAAFWDAEGDPAVVTGFGGQAQLRRAAVPIRADAVCDAAYTPAARQPDYDPALMVCAGAGGADACQGDSGSALVVDVTPSGPARSWRHVGIVSHGEGCGDPAFPGVYTQVDAFRPFLAAAPPVSRIEGAPVEGGTLTCPTEGVTGTATTVFRRLDAGGATLARFTGPSYVAGAADVGHFLSCEVTVTGAQRARTGTFGTGPVTAAPPPPPAAPGEGAGASAPPAPVAPAPVAVAPRDVVGPSLRVERRRCVQSRCTLTVRAADPSGLRRVTATVLTTVGGKRRVRSVGLRRVGPGRYRLVVSLPRGRQARLTVIAEDRAQNASRRLKTVLRRPGSR